MSFKASNNVEQALLTPNTPFKVKFGVEENPASFCHVDHSEGNDHDIVFDEAGEYSVVVQVKDYERNSKTKLRLLVNGVEQEEVKQDTDGAYCFPSQFGLAVGDVMCVEYSHNGTLNQAIRVGSHVRVNKDA